MYIPKDKKKRKGEKDASSSFFLLLRGDRSARFEMWREGGRLQDEGERREKAESGYAPFFGFVLLLGLVRLLLDCSWSARVGEKERIRERETKRDIELEIKRRRVRYFNFILILLLLLEIGSFT